MYRNVGFTTPRWHESPIYLPSDDCDSEKHDPLPVLVEDDSLRARSNHRDEIDLARFGKRQQLKRGFRLLSIIGLTCTLMITWEAVFFSTVPGGFIDGGSAGLIYGWLFVWVGNILQTLIMAEMGSMIPVAGGQYNWVAVLAPPSVSKLLSYLTGWMAFIGWQANLAGACYISATILQGLLVLNVPDYDFQRWHGTLLLYAFLALALLVNTVLARLLPQIESIVMVVHILGFFFILIPLVYLSPHASAAEVFTVFRNDGDWQTTGLAFFIGLTGSMFSFIGIDAAAHMAEEIENPRTVIPQSMIVSVVINGFLGLAMLIAFMFCAGDMESVIDSPTHYPFIEIFVNTTQSYAAGSVMSALIMSTMVFACFGFLATSSRMTWAFARERGLPGHRYLSRVHTKTRLPLYSIALSSVITLLLGLINIGSSACFNALISLTIAAFYSCFCLSALVFAHRLLTSDLTALKGPFSLGRWSIWIACASVVYSAIGIFFSFWPVETEPSLKDMNWSVVVYCGFLAFSIVYWAVWARRFYIGPVNEVSTQMLERMKADVRLAG